MQQVKAPSRRSQTLNRAEKPTFSYDTVASSIRKGVTPGDQLQVAVKSVTIEQHDLSKLPNILTASPRPGTSPLLSSSPQIMPAESDPNGETYCALCKQSFTSASRLANHIKFSTVHEMNVKSNVESEAFYSPAQARLIYEGSKLFWRTNKNLDVHIHIVGETLCVAAYDAEKELEYPRLLLEYKTVMFLVGAKIQELAQHQDQLGALNRLQRRVSHQDVRASYSSLGTNKIALGQSKRRGSFFNNIGQEMAQAAAVGRSSATDFRRDPSSSKIATAGASMLNSSLTYLASPSIMNQSLDASSNHQGEKLGIRGKATSFDTGRESPVSPFLRSGSAGPAPSDDEISKYILARLDLSDTEPVTLILTGNEDFGVVTCSTRKKRAHIQISRRRSITIKEFEMEAEQLSNDIAILGKQRDQADTLQKVVGNAVGMFGGNRDHPTKGIAGFRYAVKRILFINEYVKTKAFLDRRAFLDSRLGRRQPIV